MIQGAITGLILGLIALFGAYLFKVVPNAKQKSVSFAMIGLGILMMLSNIPYSFGMIKQNNTLDIVFLSLLFGGGLLAFVGLTLKKNNRQANDYSEPEPDIPESTSTTGGSLLFGFCVIALALLKLAVALNTEMKPNKPVAPPLPKPRVAVTNVESIDQALGLLFNGYPNEKTLAWQFLADNRDDDPDRVSEVGSRLARLANDSFDEELTVRALDNWFCPEMANSLVARLENGDLSGLKKELHKLFGEKRSMTAARYLSNIMPESGSSRALRKIGPPALKFVIHHIHSENHFRRTEARDLTGEWAIDSDRLIQASIDDVRTENGNNIEIVAPYLNRLLSNANKAQQTEIAELTEQSIANPEIEIDRSVVKLMIACAREPETPAAVLRGFKLRNELKDKKKLQLNVRREMEKLLKHYQSPEIEDFMLDAWLNEQGGDVFMTKNKSPRLVKKVAALWDTLDVSQLEKTCSKVKDAVPLVFESCFEDLKSDDSKKIGNCFDWLEIYRTKNRMFSLRRSVFKPYEADVRTAIREKLKRLDEFDSSLAEKIVRVGKLWDVDQSDQKAQ